MLHGPRDKQRCPRRLDGTPRARERQPKRAGDPRAAFFEKSLSPAREASGKFRRMRRKEQLRTAALGHYCCSMLLKMQEPIRDRKLTTSRLARSNRSTIRVIHTRLHCNRRLAV